MVENSDSETLKNIERHLANISRHIDREEQKEQENERAEEIRRRANAPKIEVRFNLDYHAPFAVEFMRSVIADRDLNKVRMLAEALSRRHNMPLVDNTIGWSEGIAVKKQHGGIYRYVNLVDGSLVYAHQRAELSSFGPGIIIVDC